MGCMKLFGLLTWSRPLTRCDDILVGKGLLIKIYQDSGIYRTVSQSIDRRGGNRTGSINRSPTLKTDKCLNISLYLSFSHSLLSLIFRSVIFRSLKSLTDNQHALQPRRSFARRRFGWFRPCRSFACSK